MIDFQRVRELAAFMTPAEFDQVWTDLGQALRTAYRARQRHNIAVLALRNMTGGLSLIGFEGPHSNLIRQKEEETR